VGYELKILEGSVVQDFRNLEVWKRAHELVLIAYGITENFPRSEMFGLSSQIRRAASSIPTNLAEGCGRTQAEFARFVQIALGSACELEYELLLVKDLGLITNDVYASTNEKMSDVKRMLQALLRRVQRDLRNMQESSYRRADKVLN
jgi:four helix bundle protein